SLPEPFMVAAPENPVEYEGTYPLPEAQLDRFLFKLVLDLPSREHEFEILDRHARGFDAARLSAAGLRRVADADLIARAREAIAGIYIARRSSPMSSISPGPPGRLRRWRWASPRAVPPGCSVPP